MIFRQLFDRVSCTYTYLLGDEASGEAVLIDPVREHVDRDLGLLADLGLRLVMTLETHVHADHVTSSGLLRRRAGSQSAVSEAGGAPCADLPLRHGQLLRFGAQTLEVRATPGHTDGCVAFVSHAEGMVFTGDTLLIRGCGRTDFQQGDARRLYQSVHEQLFSLSDATFVYPGHDYQGRTRTTIGEERALNPRLGGGRTAEDLAEIMEKLGLAYPAQIDVAVPANQQCGWLPGDPVRTAASAPAWAPVTVVNGVPEVDIAWVSAQGAIRRVDVRRLDEWEGELGRVPGSELCTLDGLGVAAAEWDKAAPIIIICRSGARSGRGANLLLEAGFAKVASMAGGMLAWKEAGFAVERA